jgi:hypothetical protein
MKIPAHFHFANSTLALVLLVLSGSFVPAFVHAQAATTGALTFSQIVGNIVIIVSTGLIPLLYALAIIYLMYGIVRYFFIEGGEEGQQKGRKSIMYGLIGIVVIFAVWGLVNILLTTLNSVAGTTSPSISTLTN